MACSSMAVSWNYRMINFFANVDEGWLQRDGKYPRSAPLRLSTRPSIAFSRFWALLELFEAEQVFIDARFVGAEGA